MLLGIARAELKAPGAARNSASSHSRRRRKSSMSCHLRSPLSRHHGTSRPPPVSSAWSCRPASHLPGPICLGLQQFTRRAALLPCCPAALLPCCSAALLLCCSAAPAPAPSAPAGQTSPCNGRSVKHGASSKSRLRGSRSCSCPASLSSVVRIQELSCGHKA